MTVTAGPTPRTLARRLLPLQIAMGLQGMILWVPVEKLFMSEIGFTPVSVGLMAAAYAAVVPVLEVPSGILADRWSRSWVMILATVALLASTLVGGLSHNVPTYVASAMIVGVYFALNSGTVDSIVYDTVLEETGSSALYETWIGRIRMVESGALVVSSLAGGVLAGWTSTRVTYFASLPIMALAIVAFLRFDEPRLHRSATPEPLGRHVALTFRTMVRQPGIRQVMLLSALAGLLAQAVFEFGPLWLVALTASAALFGPYWAGMVSTMGLGGYLAGKLNLDRALVVSLIAAVGVGASITLALSRSLAVVIAAQIVLVLLLMIIGIHAGRLLHDAVPSTIRAGVASGVGTLTWLLFLPFALLIGWLARERGVHSSAWLLTAAALLVGILLVVCTHRAPVVAVPAEAACEDLVDQVTDYLEDTLPAEDRREFASHLDICDGCTEYVEQIRTTVDALGTLGERAVSGDRTA